MTLASRVCSVALCALLAVAALPLGGCHQNPPAPRAKPQVSPPAIKTEATLRTGVNLSYPPFAGVDQGQNAGIDVDVADALAGRLGLVTEFVDVKPSGIASALADGDADIVLSAPFSADVLSQATIAGTYISDGPVLFAGPNVASDATTSSIVASDSLKIGAQSGSEAYWRLVAERGNDAVNAYPSLREAFTALARGDVDCVGCDAVVGGYMARDVHGVRFAGPLADAHLLGIAVASDNTKLADAVRRTLDRLAADGVLDTIRTTWVGPLPKLPLPGPDTSATLQVTPTSP